MKQKGGVSKDDIQGELSPLPTSGEPAHSEILREPEAAYVVERVRDGLGFSEFQALRELLGLTEERMGALLGMSRATLHRRKKSGHLDCVESDRLVRYARLLNSASGLFKTHEKAAAWRGSPSVAVKGESPVE